MVRGGEVGPCFRTWSHQRTVHPKEFWLEEGFKWERYGETSKLQQTEIRGAPRNECTGGVAYAGGGREEVKAFG